MRSVINAMVVAVAALVSLGAYGQEYVDLVNEPASRIAGRTVTIDQTNNSLAVGDVVIPATFCDANSDFTCLKSDAITFGVPKRGSLPNAWTIGERRFVTIRQLRSSIAGIPPPFLIIKAEADPSLEFTFSERYGLVAFSKDKSSLYITGSRCGFAAKSSVCNQDGKTARPTKSN